MSKFAFPMLKLVAGKTGHRTRSYQLSFGHLELGLQPHGAARSSAASERGSREPDALAEPHSPPSPSQFNPSERPRHITEPSARGERKASDSSERLRAQEEQVVGG